MRAVVTGVGHHLPGRVVTTAEVEHLVAERGGFSLPGGIVQLLTGVRQRHWAAADETSSDYAAAAGRAALDHAGLHPMAIDVLICANASHDVAEPATSAIVQSKLGCRNAAVMDVKNACNGFLNGLDVAAALVQTGRAGRVLVTAGEVLSPAIDWDIHGMADLRGKLAGLTLGDAGAAFVVAASDEPDGAAGSGGSAWADDGAARGIRQGDFMTDGDHWELSTVLAGGNLVRHRDVGRYFHCRSDDLAKLAVRHLPDLFTKTRARVGWENEDIALVVPHQVSRAVVVDLAKLWNYPLSRCMVTVDRFGNTAAASVPLAASVAVAEGRLSPGDKVVLVAGAAGFSAGVLPVVW
jgi:3-oxoacyl-[acyl-carrier-protein] synthase-3